MPVSQALSSELEDSLQHFFKHGIYHQGAKAELIRVARWPDIKGKVRWSVPKINRHAKRISLIAEQGEGRFLRRWYVAVQVRWWANVVTVRQELPARTLLQASMLQVERKDIAGHVGAWWKQGQALQGMRLMRPLHAHDVVFSNTVKRPPAIMRGDRITMIAGNGLFSVKAECLAMKSAGVGERILVQNMRSKQRVQAVVVNSHTVRVQI